MKILEHIAQDIAEKTSAILNYPISITDNEGYIIGSTDRNRLGIFHQPSLEVIRKKGLINCKNEIVKQILPGVSVPIVFNNKTIGVLGIVGDPQEVEKYVHLVKNQVEMMCQEAFRKEMKELESKMIEVFIQQLIHYDTDEQQERVTQYAKTLGYNPDINRCCVLIDIHQPTSKQPIRNTPYSFPYFQRDVIDYIQLIFHESKEDIISFIGMEKVIVVKPVKTKEAYAALRSSLQQKLDKLTNFLSIKYDLSASLAVGDIQQGVSGISHSFRQAEKAMNLGRNKALQSGIYIYNEKNTTFELLPKEITPELQQTLLALIQPLSEHDHYDMLSSTFIKYCQYNLNLSETARKLYVHRNTIIYRLEKITELTQLNTSQFNDCMLLHLAISCYEHRKDEGT
ncbi:CdaR family transcriptional regulator [Bacillus sp. FJAT-42315]|uniref:CdaR family transcriptional regulator n=1 Tax=Bacillus sp. FJAT-42315 TaxID=2014077 RepID=UPI000C24D8C3|nr:sugar diacid recognition domain-containing protein [Bacillus sp. FJAT-42315]